jgi:hypothetical protein
MLDRRRRWGAARKGVLIQAQTDRFLDARALLLQARWAGAVYMAGYVVECLLKAIALTRGSSIQVSREDRHHDLDRLVDAARLRRDLERPEARAVAESLGLLVAVWDVSMRYGTIPVNQERAIQVLSDVERIRRWLLERI